MEDIWHIMTKRYGKSRYMSRRRLNCMEDAIDKEQFKVYFQPKYDLNSEKVAGAVAL